MELEKAKKSQDDSFIITDSHKELVKMFLLHNDLRAIFFDPKYNGREDYNTLDQAIVIFEEERSNYHQD